MRATYVVMTSGVLDRPKLPGIPGIDDFKGHIFHTSRWDYGYTGGDTNGNLTGLADKKVGILGTGATAIQSIPHLGASAGELFVFQRTPSVVLERNNRPTDPEWAATLEPGWYSKRQNNFNVIVTGGHQDYDDVDDMWTYICSKVTAFGYSEPPAGMSARGLGARAGGPRCPADGRGPRPGRPHRAPTRRPPNRSSRGTGCCASGPRSTTPTCRRSTGPTCTWSTLTAVASNGRRQKGLVVDGKEYELDCLILATGFDTGSSATKRAGYDVIGRNGVKMSDKFAQGYRTFHGFYSNGFPNLFIMGITQKGGTPNVPHSMRVQADHIAWVVSQDPVQGREPVRGQPRCRADRGMR